MEQDEDLPKLFGQISFKNEILKDPRIYDSVKSLYKAWRHEFDTWIDIFGSWPVALIESKDESHDYTMDRAHIFELANGQYAFVGESGCSCYTVTDAEITLCSNERDARNLFDEWWVRP